MTAEVVTTPYVIDGAKVTEFCSAACAADYARELVAKRRGWEARELRPGQWSVRQKRLVGTVIT